MYAEVPVYKYQVLDPETPTFSAAPIITTSVPCMRHVEDGTDKPRDKNEVGIDPSPDQIPSSEEAATSAETTSDAPAEGSRLCSAPELALKLTPIRNN